MRWRVQFQSEEIKHIFWATNRKILIAGHTTHIETYIVQKHIERLVPNTQTIVIDKKLPLYLCNMLNIHHKPARKPNFITKLSKDIGDDDFCLIWYPSAGLCKWKTGAFVFSKLKHAHLFVLGIDYSKKLIMIDSYMTPVEKEDEIELYIHRCKENISKYTPYVLTSDDAFVHNSRLASIFSKKELVMIFVPLLYFHIYFRKHNIVKFLVYLIILSIFHFVIIMSNASDIRGFIHKTTSLSEPLLTLSLILLIDTSIQMTRKYVM